MVSSDARLKIYTKFIESFIGILEVSRSHKSWDQYEKDLTTEKLATESQEAMAQMFISCPPDVFNSVMRWKAISTQKNANAQEVFDSFANILMAMRQDLCDGPPLVFTSEDARGIF